MPFLPMLLLSATLLGQTAIGRVSDSQLREPSALEASLRFPGVFWTVCDSGNPPHLIALDRQGHVLARYRLAGAVNLDWECLALDDAGRLFIGDVGNNPVQGRSRLPQRWVYAAREPDPRQARREHADPAEPHVLALERTILMRYPEGPLDIEAAFAWGDAVYLVSKVRRDTALYRLQLGGKPADGESESPVTLERVADLPGVDRATSASLSPDRRRLAICTYHEVWLYEVAEGASFRLSENRPAARLPFRADVVEACAWDGRNLLLLNEYGVLYRLDAG